VTRQCEHEKDQVKKHKEQKRSRTQQEQESGLPFSVKKNNSRFREKKEQRGNPAAKTHKTKMDEKSCVRFSASEKSRIQQSGAGEKVCEITFDVGEAFFVCFSFFFEFFFIFLWRVAFRFFSLFFFFFFFFFLSFKAEKLVRQCC